MDNNNKDNFDVDIRHRLDDLFKYFLLAHALEYLLDVTLGVQCILHLVTMKECGWYKTYVHLSHDHEQKKTTIYQY